MVATEIRSVLAVTSITVSAPVPELAIQIGTARLTSSFRAHQQLSDRVQKQNQLVASIAMAQ